MRRLSTSFAPLASAAILAAACGTERPTDVTGIDPSAARGGGSAPAYTSTDVGALLGNYSSRANAVNDAGDVAASTSCCNAGTGGFAIVAGAVTPLPGTRGNALAISNGSPLYVAGSAGETSQPVRWSISGGTPSQPTNLALLAGEVVGAALGVNDAGDAVGRAGNSAAMWSAAGARTTVPAPPNQGFVRGEGRDINNAGHAVFVFFIPSAEFEGGRARGYLRLASGGLVELAPLPGDITSYVNGLSEVANNALYVAGSTRTSADVMRAVRWKVDVTTGQILSAEVRSERSHALAVSNAGGAAGFVEGPPNSLKSSAFLWRGSSLLALDPPTGGKDARAWAESPSGKFVAGDAVLGTSRRAVRWTILAP